MSTAPRSIRKTGILGGTFDPIHIGHLLLAVAAYEQAQLDRVLIMPTGISYFKAAREMKVTDPQTRLLMAGAAIKGVPFLECSDIEARRAGNSYTFETMEELRSLYPDDELYYIVGADALCMMHLWKEPERIFRSCRILVTERAGQVGTERLQEAISDLKERYGAVIDRITLRNIDISSTDIRERVMQNKPIRWMVPETVEEFIRENGLYRGEAQH